MEEFAYRDDGRSLLGILYAEDFDDPPPPPVPLVAVETFDQDQVDRACIAAVASARLQWEASLAVREADLLSSLHRHLVETDAEREQLCLATAEATVQTILAVLTAAVPHFMREHAAAETVALVTHLLPTLRAEPQVTIRVAAELVDGLERAIGKLELDDPIAIAVLPGNLRPGDLRISWANGNLTRDTAQIAQAVHDALGLLGLHAPTGTLPERSMAHAE